MFAVNRVGGIISGASPAYNVEEMTYALKTAGAKFLFTSPSSIDVAEEAAKNAGVPKSNMFLLEGEKDGYTTVQELFNMGESFGEQKQVPPYQIPDGKSNAQHCGFLSFSSGTTGLPKAVSDPIPPYLDICYSLPRTGHDLPPKRHRPNAASLHAHTRRPQTHPRLPAPLPHHGPRAPNAPPRPPQRRGLHAA